MGALFAATRAPLIVTDAATAETIKYASNAFLATKLSFVNSIACLCEAVGADVRDVLLGMGYDPRIGFDYLRPGPGLGRIVSARRTPGLFCSRRGLAGYDFDLLRSVIEANDRQREEVVGKITEAAGGALSRMHGSRSWGLTFKAGTDDRRDSPVDRDRSRRLRRGCGADAPTTRPSPAPIRPTCRRSRSPVDPYAACDGARVLVVLTEWDELRWLDFDKVHATARSPLRRRRP